MRYFFTSLLIIFCFYSLGALYSEASAQAFADTNSADFYSEFYVMEVKPMQFKVTYHYPMEDRVRLRIIGGSGDIIFSEKALVYKKYQKLFDLSIFSDGEYTFELTDGTETYKKSFSILTKTTRVATTRENSSVIVAGF